VADTAVAITAGAGTNIDTRTEATNGNHRQVIVIGDPSTNAGVAPVDVTKGLAVDLTATGANGTALNVNVGTSGLPTGAATQTTLAAIQTLLTPATGFPVKVDLSATGTVAPLAAAQKLRVVSYVLVANGTVTVNWQSHTTTATKTGPMYLAANTGVASGYNPLGHFDTVAGEALDLALSAAVAVGGHVTYVKV